MTTYARCQFVNVDDVWDLLRKHMPTLPEDIPSSLDLGLSRLQGRPMFFFDQLLAHVFQGPFPENSAEWPDDVKSITNDSARRLAGRVFENLDHAWESSVAMMDERINHWKTPTLYPDCTGYSDRAGARHFATMIMKSFLGCTMRDTDIVGEDDFEDRLRYGAAKSFEFSSKSWSDGF